MPHTDTTLALGAAASAIILSFMIASCTHRADAPRAASSRAPASTAVAGTASALAPAASGTQPAITTEPHAAPREPITRKGAMDVTFAVISDLHFGYGGVAAEHATVIDRLNAIGTVKYPRYLTASTLRSEVGALRGLLVTGDLTQLGTRDQWAAFQATYGNTERLHVPVFEVIGNHDRASGTYVDSEVAKRHGGRFYSYQWDDLHVVALNEAPGDDGLAYLEDDLATVAADVPLVLYFHLPFLGPWAQGWWFADGPYPEKLAAILKGRNVAAIFHGHHHALGHYQWKGIDVFKPGPVKDGVGIFSIVRVTDKTFSVLNYNYRQNTLGGGFTKVLK
jgi:predicted phosphodiesterase